MSSERTTVIVDGKALAQQIRSELAEKVKGLVEAGRRPPCLAVVLVGDNPASASYIKGKRRACARVGMESVERRLPGRSNEADLLAVVAELDRDDGIDGILVQLPLPAGVRPAAIAEAIEPAKDVDGLHPVNSGRLLQGVHGLAPCTPLGIIEILDRHGVAIEGARAVVIGRSEIVGKPLGLLLLHRHATVTLCHSRTRDLRGLCRDADILVAAVGRARLVQRDWIKPGAAVIDVGVNEVDGQLVGDVDFEGVQGVAGLVTPPRGGVGPMTITMLLRNTLQAYCERTGA
jgi:methylenetetrahydrofolate dehydrogenase (NADP+)/methenyltetrahydrofolate cyclohydrolase